MEFTILETADRLQELLADNDFEDVPVLFQTEHGQVQLSEENFSLEELEGTFGETYMAVVIRI